MKKLLLSLGTIATIVAPISATIACSGDDDTTLNNGDGNTDTNGAAKTETNTDKSENSQKDNNEKIVGDLEQSKQKVIDEGFNEAPLIENFDMAKENPTFTFAYDNKTYDNLAEPLALWVNSMKNIVESEIENMPGGAPGAVFSAILENGKIKCDVKIGGNSILSGNEQVIYDSFDELVSKGFKGNKAILSDEPIFKMANSKKIIMIEKQTNNSIDSIIYSQAQKLTNDINTEIDKAYIESSTAIYKRNDQSFDLLPYAERNPKFPISAEFRPGDSVVFAFDKESDLSSFTQRVRYLDTMAPGYHFTSDPSTLKSSTTLKVKDGKIIAEENTALMKTIQLYSLEVIAKNAVRLTFSPFMETNGETRLGEAFIFNAFNDINGDGKIDCNDVSVTNQFVIDLNKLSENYLPFVKADTFISGYDEAEAKLNK